MKRALNVHSAAIHVIGTTIIGQWSTHTLTKCGNSSTLRMGKIKLWKFTHADKVTNSFTFPYTQSTLKSLESGRGGKDQVIPRPVACIIVGCSVSINNNSDNNELFHSIGFTRIMLPTA